jgi:[acyl-carrier-protein] S-malonyltransferase
MKPAAEEMRERLRGLTIRAPSMRVHSFDAGVYGDADSIRDGLYWQLFNPVCWSAIVAAIVGARATHLVECGPGKVLMGLARRTPGGRNLNLQAVESPETLDAALKAVEGSEGS